MLAAFSPLQENQNILKDLGMLQAHLRDFEGYLVRWRQRRDMGVWLRVFACLLLSHALTHLAFCPFFSPLPPLRRRRAASLSSSRARSSATGWGEHCGVSRPALTFVPLLSSHSQCRSSL